MSNTLKTHFAANMQENINNLKASIVRAEASHMIDDIDGLRKHYAEVLAENGALIGEYQKRTNNHQDLLKDLKQLNNYIRLGSHLRVGEPQKTVVALCRDCIRTNKIRKLKDVIEKGAE